MAGATVIGRGRKKDQSGARAAGAIIREYLKQQQKNKDRKEIFDQRMTEIKSKQKFESAEFALNREAAVTNTLATQKQQMALQKSNQEFTTARDRLNREYSERILGVTNSHDRDMLRKEYKGKGNLLQTRLAAEREVAGLELFAAVGGDKLKEKEYRTNVMAKTQDRVDQTMQHLRETNLSEAEMQSEMQSLQTYVERVAEVAELGEVQMDWSVADPWKGGNEASMSIVWGGAGAGVAGYSTLEAGGIMDASTGLGGSQAGQAMMSESSFLGGSQAGQAMLSEGSFGGAGAAEGWTAIK